MQQYQYGDSPYVGAPALPPGAAGAVPGRTTSPLSSPSHYTTSEHTYYPQSTSDASGYYPYRQPMMPSQQIGGVLAPGSAYSHGHSPPESVSGRSGSAREAKEREAAARFGGGRGGLGLATQHEGEDADGVVVHRDGGRVDDVNPREIPPTYDSIPADGR
ncbi:hypothetical protein SERLA73DRAFT_191659 [Serpula lacrymans var. lacrymans S7.3]|uniref:Uncharacterized protein n=1 Tax=Serpula lacrymans var. lacrymans (strain S7.3) TaxID=936435 RepID=F8QI13_SERL3|nr:hypothetical protein SERLA73DRAFT_191659 [Serpula lacrymans var. lacrymans S7.3]